MDEGEKERKLGKSWQSFFETLKARTALFLAKTGMKRRRESYDRLVPKERQENISAELDSFAIELSGCLLDNWESFTPLRLTDVQKQTLQLLLTSIKEKSAWKQDFPFTHGDHPCLIKQYSLSDLEPLTWFMFGFEINQRWFVFIQSGYGKEDMINFKLETQEEIDKHPFIDISLDNFRGARHHRVQGGYYNGGQREVVNTEVLKNNKLSSITVQSYRIGVLPSRVMGQEYIVYAHKS